MGSGASKAGKKVDSNQETTKHDSAAAFIQGTGGDVNWNVGAHARLSLRVGDNITNIQQPSAPKESPEEQLKKIFATLHRNTWEKTNFNIGDGFKADKFPEPNFEVYPQMAASPKFYQGGGHPVAAVDNSSMKTSLSIKMTSSQKTIFSRFRDLFGKSKPVKDSKESPQITKKVFTSQYVKEKVSEFKKEENPLLLSTEALMQKIHAKKEKLGILGLVAQAGAGKTTCMRRWARTTMETNGMAQKNGLESSDESRFDFIHFMNFKDIKASKKTTLEAILFQELFRSSEDQELIYTWLLQHQEKAVIFLDGLDQAQWKIDSDDVQVCGRYDSASTSTILYNLLSRNLLPGVRIIISSREFAATSLPEEAWIDDVITLTGFSEGDAKKLFNAVTDKNAVPDTNAVSEEVNDPVRNQEQPSNWDILTKRSSSLLPFISIPAFLMFSAIVFNFYGIPPTGVTDLMSKVLGTLQYSLIIQEGKNIWTILSKLKKLSHKGMKNGLVIFSEEDLRNCDLDIKDVRDLLLMVPKSRSLTHRLIEGDNVFFFSHQSLQEFFCACAIAELSLSDFRRFVKLHLHKGRWSVVQRFLCGLVFANSPNEQLVNISDKAFKQQIIRESLETQLSSADNFQLLELYAAFYESNDDQLIRSSITKINLRDTPLGRDGAHLVSSLAGRCKDLELYSFYGCKLNDDLLEIMAGNFKNTMDRVQITRVCLVEYEGSKGFSYQSINKVLQNINCDDIWLKQDQASDNPVGPDWKNIRKLSELYANSMKVSMLNQPDSVKIEVQLMMRELKEGRILRDFTGTFNKANKLLCFDVDVNCSCNFVELTAAALGIAEYNLKPISKSISMNGHSSQLYMQLGFLDWTRDWTINAKVDEIVLDCLTPTIEEDENPLDPEKICHVVRQFQVKVLIVVIKIWNLDEVPDNLDSDLALLGCKLEIHASLKVRDPNDLRQQVPSMMQYQYEYLQLMIKYFTMEDLMAFITFCDVRKQLKIISWFNCWTITDAEKEFLQGQARERNFELAFEGWQGRLDGDLWSHLFWL